MGKLLNLYASWDAVRRAGVYSGIRRATQRNPSHRSNSSEPAERSQEWRGTTLRRTTWEAEQDRILTADTDLAEAQQDAPAAHGTSEAQLRTKLGKQENLVELALYRGIVRAG